MASTFNIYCDESCHLEHDSSGAMVIGAVLCPTDDARRIAKDVHEIKVRHGVGALCELKWTKISPSKLPLYLDVLDYFFDQDALRFRGVLIPDKSKLRHECFNHDHNTWYYKMFYIMLREIIDREHKHRIFIDVKDTHGASRVRQLRAVLSSNLHDFRQKVIASAQLVHSHEIVQMQLCDLLIGAIGYLNRGLSGSSAKLEFIRKFKQRSGLPLNDTTPRSSKKINLLKWTPSEATA